MKKIIFYIIKDKISKGCDGSDYSSKKNKKKNCKSNVMWPTVALEQARSPTVSRDQKGPESRGFVFIAI